MKGGKGKGDKSLKKLLNSTKTEEIYEGALELNKHVAALFEIQDGNQQWELAKILEIKLIDINSKKKKTEYSYEYYVHYVNFNRRHDKWIKRDEIKLDETFVDEKLKEKQKNDKEKNIFINDDHAGLDKNSLITHEEATKVKTILELEMGKYKSECWYFSPYPEGYHDIKCLYLCEFCLNFYVDKSDQVKHCSFCPLKHPPGNEIYRDDKISMFEVDGRKERMYCENLCYLGKLFLDHKTLAWDVEPFLFYILCEYDEYGYHFVGYFSKEKESSQDFNVACILTLPFYQRKGYGKFLIDFSYLLSRKENKIASPEEPLSDLGFATYFSYWTQAIIKVLLEYKDPHISIQRISELTSIRPQDISKVLEELTIMRHVNNQHIIIADERILLELDKKAGQKGFPLYPEKLLWTPYKMKFDFDHR